MARARGSPWRRRERTVAREPDAGPWPRALVAGAAVVATLLLVAAMVRCAWLGDDAFITLRTVENVLAGHGAVWNPGERVQTYTHPLWLLLLVPARWLAGDGYAAAIALGLLLSTAAALGLVVRAGLRGAAAIALLLVGSRAFVEYSTSGLETSLVFALAVLFVRELTGAHEPRRRLLRAAAVAGLLALTRIDLVLLCGPALLAAARGLPLRAAAARLALGLAPFAAWLAFAAFYYGTPLPITAYAKVLHDIPAGELGAQGLAHLAHGLQHDPVTFAAIALGVGLAFLRPLPGTRALAAGAVLYCGYVVAVGGDFMGTRFYGPPFVVAAALLAGWARTAAPAAVAALAAGAVVLHLLPGPPGWWSAPANDRPSHAPYRGITDERAFYHPRLGLLSPSRDVPVAGLGSRALAAAGRTRRLVVPTGFVGRFGYVAGPLVHVCDSWLCDPLLMRLPGHPELMAQPHHGLQWRVGHYARRIPEGYLETLAHGTNAIADAGLARAYTTLRTVVRAPLLAPERWRALWALWTGAHRGDLERFAATGYLEPPRVRVAAGELGAALPAGALWFDDPRVRLVYHGGLAVELAAPTAVRRLPVLLHGGPRYTFRFRAQGRELGSSTVDCTQQDWLLGLRPHTIAVPADVGTFDELWVDAPTDSETVAALAGLQCAP